MREALFLLGTLVLVPYLLLAIAFVLLGQAISSGTLWSMFGTLLKQANWILPWGILGFISVMCAVGALGLSSRFRWMGGICLSVLAAGGVAALILGSSASVGVDELTFLLPCAVVFGYGLWLAVAELRSRRENGRPA